MMTSSEIGRSFRVSLRSVGLVLVLFAGAATPDRAAAQSTSEQSLTAQENPIAQQSPLYTFHFQFVNVSSDPTLGSADFYGDASRLANNLERNAATPFLTVVSGDRFRLTVADNASESTSEGLLSDTLDAADDISVMAALIGLVDPDSEHNPDGHDVALAFAVNQFAKKDNTQTDTVLVNVLHAGADASWLHVAAGAEGETVVAADSVIYGEYSDYVAIPLTAESGTFSIYLSQGFRNESCGGDAISPYEGCFQIDSAILAEAGTTFTIVVPEPNHLTGYPVVLAVFPNGTVVTIDIHASLGVEDAVVTDRIETPLTWYPSPADNSASADILIEESGFVSLEITDLLGRLAISESYGFLPAGESHRLIVDSSHLANGIYLSRLVVSSVAGDEVRFGRIAISR